MNRKPDLVVLRPEHIEQSRQAIMLGHSVPLLVAEAVSSGGPASENYLRDYVWKRQQYQDWEIPEYWIIDPHREKVTVLTLVDDTYQETVFADEAVIRSEAFPELELRVDALISGQIDD